MTLEDIYKISEDLYIKLYRNREERELQKFFDLKN